MNPETILASTLALLALAGLALLITVDPISAENAPAPPCEEQGKEEIN